MFDWIFGRSRRRAEQYVEQKLLEYQYGLMQQQRAFSPGGIIGLLEAEAEEVAALYSTQRGAAPAARCEYCGCDREPAATCPGCGAPMAR